MPVLVVDLAAVACLAGALAVAVIHPRGRWEALYAVAATALLLAIGAVDLAGVREQVGTLLPVVGFLVAILVVADACAAEGLFRALGDLARRTCRDSPRRLLLVTFGTAAVTTAVLSLDATVVLLTPVIAAATWGTLAHRAGVHSCVRLANSASLLLPVSNLTNLLALPHLEITFLTWLLVVAPVWVAVIVVEYAATLVVFAEARRPAVPSSLAPAPDPVRIPWVPVAVVAVMLVGFVVGSSLHVEPVWVTLVAAAVLVLRGRRRRTLTTARVVRATHLPFAVFVLGLGVVVLGVTESFLGSAVASLVPERTGLLGMLLVALLATALANMINNLPATLLLIPLIAPLGPAMVLAALIGLNVGSGLTYPGSLANLLWRRSLRRDDHAVDGWLFHRHALIATPPALLVGVLVLWAMTAGTGLLHA